MAEQPNIQEVREQLIKRAGELGCGLRSVGEGRDMNGAPYEQLSLHALPPKTPGEVAAEKWINQDVLDPERVVNFQNSYCRLLCFPETSLGASGYVAILRRQVAAIGDSLYREGYTAAISGALNELSNEGIYSSNVARLGESKAAAKVEAP